MRLAWHFLRGCSVTDRPILRDWRRAPHVGQWLVHRGRVRICRSGLHASYRLNHALRYVDWPGLVYATLVQAADIVDGYSLEHPDKLVCRRRKILGICLANPAIEAICPDGFAGSYDALRNERAGYVAYFATADPKKEAVLESALLSEMGLDLASLKRGQK